MTRSEYERRRRALEEQLRVELELARAGHEARIQALERLWSEMAAEEESGDAPVPSEGGDGRRVAGAEASPPAAVRQPSAPARPAVPPAAKPRRPENETYYGILDALPGLPEVFDKRDVVRALGYEPARTTLVRNLQELLLQEKIAVVQATSGRNRTKYRKL